MAELRPEVKVVVVSPDNVTETDGKDLKVP